ncbi:hypothetical protein B0H19DRAFT_1303485 [Mycena capillaripes]|nr:hypothetical protein B0H19DRAFT_1303485 [Mycena capillaripes]
MINLCRSSSMLSTLEADRTRVAELEAQIMVLERSISALRNEKSQVQERLDSYKYPLLTLPNEIISEIFIHFLPVYPRCPPLTGTHSPTNLTHICRYWREIALTTPMLWRAISLSDDEAPMARQLQRSQIWLDRSRDCPLSIIVHHSIGCVELEILAVIVPHRARWEHAVLEMSSSDLPTICGPMPLLQHLNLSLDYPNYNVVVFDDIPRLNTVVLSQYATSHLIALPWAQLTFLTLNSVYRYEYSTILRQTLNLRHCVLDMFLEDTDASAPAEFALPYLESLTLHDCWNDMEVILYPDIFIVPALRQLEIPEQFLGINPTDGLESFISQAGPKLERRLTKPHVVVNFFWKPADQRERAQ